MSPSSNGRGAPRLHIVTGKGGTGKTTVAGAVALLLASGGGKVLLCEVEGRQGIAPLFDSSSLEYGEQRMVGSPRDGEVYALAVDAEDALLEYLSMFYRLGRAGKALNRFGVIDFATTIAPGVRDVLLIGKVYEAVRRQVGGAPTYDAVVLDAPPTGRIGRFLNVNTEVAGIAKVGPIKRQATSIMRLLKSAKTAVHIVATPEEMPVQEALDATAELRSLGIGVGALVVNMARTPLLEAKDREQALAGRMSRSGIATALRAAQVPAGSAVVDGLLAEARDHSERLAMEEHQQQRLAATGYDVAVLPDVPETVDLGTLYDLADLLADTPALA